MANRVNKKGIIVSNRIINQRYIKAIKLNESLAAKGLTKRRENSISIRVASVNYHF